MVRGIVFACVAENSAPWFEKVRNLAISVRHSGGPYAASPVCALFVDAVDDAFAAALGRYDVDVEVVQRVDARRPHANKLRMLELAERRDFGHLVALDCDCIVAGDLSPYLSAAAVGLKPTDVDVLPPAQWRELARLLGVDLPPRSLTACVSGAAMYPQWNSGVVVAPRELCRPLLEAWSGALGRVLDLFDAHPEFPRRTRFYGDQIALAVALWQAGPPVQPLPLAVNYPAHVRLPARLATTPPAVVHYHHGIAPDGFLLRSPNAPVNPVLDAFNRYRATELGLTYPGLTGPGRARTLVRRTRRAVRRVLPAR